MLSTVVCYKLNSLSRLLPLAALFPRAAIDFTECKSVCVVQASITENLVPLAYALFNILSVTAIVIVNKRVFRTLGFNFPILLVNEMRYSHCPATIDTVLQLQM